MRGAHPAASVGRSIVTLAVLGTAACAAPRAPLDGPADSAPRQMHPAGGETTTRQGVHPDARFLHQMIPHHAQALVMTSLVAARTDRESIRLLAERISVSQQDEIALMRRRLDRLGGTVTPMDTSEHGADHDHELMPGMLSPEDLDRLRNASGLEFDRLFLQLMIKHHEGALVMVQQLFASPGAAQNAEMYSLASDVDSDQRAEIARMRMLLDSLRAPASP